MALEERAESNSRSLHWAPLRSWNLFSGRVRSRIPHESPLAQLPRSQSVRNYTDAGRMGSATSRGSGRPRSNESTRKGVDAPRRDHKQRVREGSHRQGGISITDEQVALHLSESTSRRRALHDRSLEASDDWPLDRAARLSTHIAHHQQHHHHDHHHHHYHYHHLHHQTSRRLNEHQDQGLRMSSASGMVSSSGSNQRNTAQRRYSRDRQTPITANLNVASNSLNAAIEARDRLDERLRGAALRHRHNNTALPAGFVGDFTVLVDDEEDAWSDDEIWEPISIEGRAIHSHPLVRRRRSNADLDGDQDWLGAWGYGEGRLAEFLSSGEPFPTNMGLSKHVIKNLPREIFVPQVRRRDKEIGGASMEHDDCSVCLERFLAGQLLVSLRCKHRFHPDCLTPWLESHGQCPYCRAKVSLDAGGEGSSRSGSNANAFLGDDDLQAWMGLTIR